VQLPGSSESSSHSAKPGSTGPWSAAATLLLVVLSLAAAGCGAPNVAAPREESGCDRPLTYDVVRIDPGHRISRAAFVALLERSERLWETPAGKDLFRYQRGGHVHVSLIYDNRQVDADKVAAEEALITRMRSSVEQQHSTIRAQEAQLNARRTRLNTRIDYWNAQGGAPPNMYVALKAEGAAIQSLTSGVNAQVGRENLAVAQLNRLLRARNLLANTADNEGGEAQLGGTEVSIFVLTRTAKDEVLIAHEFGHILGLEHVPGADNIMNPVLVKALTHASPADLQALTTSCASR
jgi:Matrixin